LLIKKPRKIIDLSFLSNADTDKHILTLNDIRYLPEPVQDYLMYVGALGRDKVNNFRVSAECSIQMDEKGWVKGVYEQNHSMIGEKMQINDTCTLFNDMCLFAPSSLIDEWIQWESIDNNTVKAVFQNDYGTVTALLLFNEAGQLINFITDDKSDVKSDGTAGKMRWSTPVKKYSEINGMNLASEVEAVWDSPEGPHCYFKITRIRSIKYNCN
jgi:hypothetical protein